MTTTRARRALGVVGGSWGAGCLAVLGLLALAGDATTATHLLGMTGPWWLGTAAALLVACAVARRPVAVALLLGPALAAAWLVAPHHPGAAAAARAAAEGGAPVLRVATWNTTAGTGAAGVLALAEEERPDVLVLQEVTDAAAAGLAPLAGRYPHAVRTPDAWAPRWGVAAGAAVWSRYPVLEVQPVDGLPAAARPAQVVVLDVDGRRVAVVSVHLASPCTACALHASDPGPAGSGGRASRVRAAEVARLVEVAAELRAGGTAVVLAGDLNAADLNEPARALAAAGLVDAFRAVAWGPGLTRVQDGVPLARIDAVLLSGVLPLRASTADPRASDHAPVVADLVLPPLL